MRERWLRIVLAVMAASGAVVGAWALLAPGSFYDDFPGGGRHWISADGPFNEHLLRDFGGLNLGLAAVALIAAVTLGAVVVRAAAVGSLLYGVPHLLYHLNHLDKYDASDQVANIASLSIAVVLPLVALALSRRQEAWTTTTRSSPASAAT